MKIAIVGLGSMGRNHYRILKSLDNECTLVGLCDITPLDGYDEPCFTEVELLLSNTKPDGVIIAAPTSLHKDIALMCIEAGVAIFIEKPAASSVEDAREILDAVERHGVKKLCGSCREVQPRCTSSPK